MRALTITIIAALVTLGAHLERRAYPVDRVVAEIAAEAGKGLPLP